LPYLVLILEDVQAKTFELTQPITHIGRSPSNDVVVPDRFASREHASIKALEDGGYEILDQGGRQPLKVNDIVISRHRLQDGDRIALGKSIIIFKTDDPASSAFLKSLAADLKQEEVEVAAVDPKKTALFTLEDFSSKDLTSQHKDHQRLMLLYEFGQTVNSCLEDPALLLAEFMTAAFKMLEAERGFVALVDEHTGDLNYEIVRDNTSDQPPQELGISKTIVHKVLRDGVSLLTYNALEDLDLEDAQSVKQYNIRSAVCAPLLNRENVLGVVYLDNRASEGIFNKEDLMFLMGMCHQAGIALGNASLHRQVVQENLRLTEAVKPHYRIIGESESIQRVFATMRKVAPTEVTVLIEGETGTGKELVARAVHEFSTRAEFPFVAVNCAAIPKELIESELFGHEKGAFTGALKARQGKFEAAHQGTIFLDEIGDMSMDTQAKVLRVLEEKELQRVGGSETLSVDVRVIAATNKDLQQAVKCGAFREDLYYRLNVVSITIPALRERPDDILRLAESFMGGRSVKISKKAAELLTSYSWPGNVRELKNSIERAMVMGDGETIQPEDLPYAIRKGGGKTIPSPLASLDILEQDHIVRVLRHTKWHKSAAAKILGITRQTLDNKIARFQLKKE
jgi:transcriptional regulator with GAF, ATPase, and Fis domain